MRQSKPFVVVIDDKIVAFADLQENGDINYFFVDAKHARQGIGTAFMTHILQTAKSMGLDNLNVNVNVNVSKSAEHFFLKSGFEKIERRYPKRKKIILENAFMHKKI